VSSRPAVLSSLLIALLYAIAVGFGMSATGRPADPTALTVGSDPKHSVIPSGFVGISLETWALESYAGTDPGKLNPLLIRLLSAISPDAGVIRIGGSSADATWWPVRGMTRPPGVSVTIDGRWLAVARALADRTRSHMILDVNLEDPDPRVSVAESRALLAGVGRRRTAALELGNEPELWGSWSWYRTSTGRQVMARRRHYDMTDYARDSARFAKAIPSVPLAGPTDWAPKWLARLHQFIAAVPRVRLVTLHRYPLAHCFTKRSAPQFPTIAHLFTTGESNLLTWGLAGAVATAHAHQLPLRLDELNSVSCSGAPGISNTFASALWALDALFTVAQLGVDGVNIHTFPGAKYALYDFTHSQAGWQARVHPEYYGVLLFTRAAPPGSRLLRLSWTSWGPLRAWATRGPDRHIRVVLINQGLLHGRTVAIRIPGGTTPASVVRLEAPSVYATTGITIGGQTFGDTTATALLGGTKQTETITPSKRGVYRITLPPASAALLTVGAG